METEKPNTSSASSEHNSIESVVNTESVAPSASTPTPDDIQKEFADFIRKKFGGAVQILTSEIRAEGLPGGSQTVLTAERAQERLKKLAEKKEARDRLRESARKTAFEFNYTPKQMKAYLDRFVIKQDEAKKALSIAVCDHYNQVKRFTKLTDKSATKNYTKQNVLLAGPTGVGKTYLVRLISELVGVPFVRADATRFTEAGYVGANVEELVRDLVSQAAGDTELAEFGIVYLDEADKLVAQPSQFGKDVGGRGVQFSLLKLMEETEIDLMSGNDPASYMQAMMELQKRGRVDKQVVNTRFVLFIVSGTYSGLKDVILRRVKAGSIGFAGNPLSRDQNDDKLMELMTTKDFVELGFEPEFMGRLPVRVRCQSLEAEDLFKVLKDSEGSIAKQYQDSFEAYGVRMTLDDSAYEAISRLAWLEKTGARGLMNVMERVFREFKYELPSLDLEEFNVTRETIMDPKRSLEELIKHASPRKQEEAPSPGLTQNEKILVKPEAL